MNIKFEERTYRSQLFHLKKLALKALSNYKFRVRSISFIQHGENTTYKIIDNRNQGYLLRIQNPYYHSDKAINEELKWLLSLNKNEEFKVPVPVQNKKNNLITRVFFDDQKIERQIIVFKWVEGRRCLTKFKDENFIELGELLAKLQISGKKQKIKYRNYWSAEGLVGKKATLGAFNKIDSLSKKENETLQILYKKNLSILKKYEKRTKKIGLFHADLHSGNIIFSNGMINPIDFDDCGYGLQMYDFGSTLYKVYRNYELKLFKKNKYIKLRNYLIEGYIKHSDLSQTDIDHILEFINARKFTAIQWLNGRSDNPKLAKRALPFTRFQIKALKKYYRL